MADLGALGGIPAARARLDAQELDLIEAARAGGATWADVAGALGLRSRQAAEQRWARLRRTCQSRVDEPAIASLRSAAQAVLAVADALPRAALVRGTLSAAQDAVPGALFSLVGHVLDDLADVRDPAVDRLRKAFGSATPHP